MNRTLTISYLKIRGRFKIIAILISCGILVPSVFFYLLWFVVDFKQLDLFDKIILCFFKYITPFVGLIFFYILNLTLFGSIVIKVDDNNISINKYFFKYLFSNKTLRLDDIKNIISNVNMSSQVRFEARSYQKGKEIQVASYTIKFLLKNGNFVELPQIYDLKSAQEIMNFLELNLKHYEKSKYFSYLVENIV